jgi:hypothetical protein
MAWFGSSVMSLYELASNAARSAFEHFVQSTMEAAKSAEETASSAVRSSYKQSANSYVAAKEMIQRVVHQAENYGEEKWNLAKQNIGELVTSAERAVNRELRPQPAGGRIQKCPQNQKAERVRDRKLKISKSKALLAKMPPGAKRDVLAHATERFERNNVAVERVRLANDAYNVGQGEPPEGWERVSGEELKELGLEADSFPQLKHNFRPSEYNDGYYSELYKMKAEVFSEERYVLAFRGTQGIKDGRADLLQAFGDETEQYTRSIKTAQKLKKILGDNFDITGHSMGGGMATAAGIITSSPTYAIDPAGVHPATLERFGGGYTRDLADKYVENYVAEGEILDSVQQSNTQFAVLGGISAVTPAGGVLLLGAGRRAMSDKGALTYGAAGPVRKIPILDNAKNVLDGKVDQGTYPSLGGRLNNLINPLQKVTLHDPYFVIAGIEQQKTDDLNVIERSIEQ